MIHFRLVTFYGHCYSTFYSFFTDGEWDTVIFMCSPLPNVVRPPLNRTKYTQLNIRAMNEKRKLRQTHQAFVILIDDVTNKGI